MSEWSEYPTTTRDTRPKEVLSDVLRMSDGMFPGGLVIFNRYPRDIQFGDRAVPRMFVGYHPYPCWINCGCPWDRPVLCGINCSLVLEVPTKNSCLKKTNVNVGTSSCNVGPLSLTVLPPRAGL
ncbi:hypothetical protein OUZ56_003335 [Daphnia magna]|uniref:Uncharacterized protein n=1 Tax=Daphnia magna TaxID=35525 RepID=A0ABR0A8M7_9CRUS|nr:hypothetical protein OUZ56_003335 [Daphnia magna]